MSTPAVLFSQMRPPVERTAEFHAWYNTDHVPARMVLPGFAGARRFESVEEPGSFLAVYDLTDLDALATDEYKVVKTVPSELTREMLSVVEGFTRFTCEQVSDDGEATTGAFLSAVAFTVPESDAAEFDRWYGDEHVPMLLEAPDWLRVRRYRVRDGEGGPWTHLALHELASLEVMDSPERARARNGPLREALAGHDWFGRSGRWLYREITHVEAARP